jgi:hypothetical protein
VETIVLVGTTKGLFALHAADRVAYKLRGPSFAGEEVYATCIDTRGATPRLFTGSVSSHWGPVLRRSDDLGSSWTEDERSALAFPDGSETSLSRIWQFTPGPIDEPDVFYAGVEPAALFRSEDGGRSFSLVQGLWDHPHRPQWEPGGGGLCLHTVLVHPSDPDRLLVAISAAGVYLSDGDGRCRSRYGFRRRCASWRPARSPSSSRSRRAPRKRPPEGSGPGTLGQGPKPHRPV